MKESTLRWPTDKEREEKEEVMDDSDVNWAILMTKLGMRMRRVT